MNKVKESIIKANANISEFQLLHRTYVLLLHAIRQNQTETAITSIFALRMGLVPPGLDLADIEAALCLDKTYEFMLNHINQCNPIIELEPIVIRLIQILEHNQSSVR